MSITILIDSSRVPAMTSALAGGRAVILLSSTLRKLRRVASAEHRDSAETASCAPPLAVEPWTRGVTC